MRPLLIVLFGSVLIVSMIVMIDVGGKLLSHRPSHVRPSPVRRWKIILVLAWAICFGSYVAIELVGHYR